MLCVSERSCVQSLRTRARKLLKLLRRDEGAATSSTTPQPLHLHRLLRLRPTRSLIVVCKRSKLCSAFAPRSMRKPKKRLLRLLCWMWYYSRPASCLKQSLWETGSRLEHLLQVPRSFLHLRKGMLGTYCTGSTSTRQKDESV